MPRRRFPSKTRPALAAATALLAVAAVVTLVNQLLFPPSGTTPTEVVEVARADEALPEIIVRVAALRSDTGSVTVAVQHQDADGHWSDRHLPASRVLPANAAADRWLVSSPVHISAVPLSTEPEAAHEHDHEEEEEATAHPDISRFFDGALAAAPATEPCTLADGTQTTCHRLTITGLPADHSIGPFCPPTTSSSADAGGIWLDGEALYDIDGDFIRRLADLYDDPNWQLYNADGTVRITNTQAAFEGAARPDVDPLYQNHCVEGRLEWLPDGEPIQTTVLIPTEPTPAAAPTQIRNLAGVTLNGVRIAASAPVDAILSNYTIAAFDDCGGHFNSTDGYHLHAALGCSGIAEPDHAIHFAYALDGYPIYTPLESDAPAALDQCNGHTHDGISYHYHANDPAQNAVLTCLSGTVERAAGTPGGPPPR